MMRFETLRDVRGTIAVMLIGVLFVNVGVLAIPQKAQAQTITVEAPGPLLAAIAATAGTSATSAGTDTTELFIKRVLDGLAWTVAKVAVASMTQSIVHWINSGFQGSPAFVTDLNQNLQGVGDAIAENFFSSLQTTTGVNLKTPFQDQVTQAVRNSYYRDTGGYNPNYNLNAVSSDPQAFLSGDFTKGGFSAWMSTVLNDDNNPIGSLYKTKKELDKQVSSAHETRLHELQWGNGFLSWRGSCKTYASGTGTATSSVSLSQTDKCVAYNIKTPGTEIADSLKKVLGAPVDQLNLADSINEIVSALMTQMVSHVLGEGGLSGISQPSSGGGTSFVDQATNPNQYTANTTNIANGFAQQVTTARTSTLTYQANWQTILAAAQSAKTALTNNTCTANYPDQAATIATVVQPVINLATANLTRAETALTTIDAIGAATQASSDADGVTAANAIASISDKYSTLFTSGALPTDAEFADAKAQATSTNSTATTPSLYSQMTQITNSCVAGT